MKTKALARGALAWLGLKPVPLAVGFEITHLCNLACGYCDRHTKMPAEMTLEQILTALEEFRTQGLAHISLDGGEPLVHKHIDEVVSFLVERGVQVYMNTNGKLVPRNIETVRKLSKVKISLDGPVQAHEAMRGAGSFDKAIAGARAAREAGVSVSFTCGVGTHNAEHIDELIDFVEQEQFEIIFQPARPSLFLDGDGESAAWVLEADLLRAALARIEGRKKTSKSIANGWASLRHFRSFPNDKKVPCDAGWVNVTMDPEGNLFHCGQVSRLSRRNNVVRQGVREAFESLNRVGCSQCWCARVVEENYAWGLRLHKMLPPLGRG